MEQTNKINRRIVLAERPKGVPTSSTLRLETAEIPTPKSNEMLLRTEFLSLDPYMRGRMSAAESYAPPVELGAVMVGGTVAEVIVSNLDGFKAGDYVLSFNGWQDYAVSDGVSVTNLGTSLEDLSLTLGIMGMPGLTAYGGLKYIGEPRPGETLVVAAATGPVGATVGQIGKIEGCRVVGVAGGSEKCGFAVETLGFDACIDHKAEDFAEQLMAATPSGVDIYFENVGGKVFEAVVPLLNTNARIPVCGLVSQYNATSLPKGPNQIPLLMRQILTRKIKMEGFIVYDKFGHLYPEFKEQMAGWLELGKIKYREDIIDGLAQAPRAFVGLLSGKNFGKLVIRVGNK